MQHKTLGTTAAEQETGDPAVVTGPQQELQRLALCWALLVRSTRISAACAV